jgi:hypothetical protein
MENLNPTQMSKPKSSKKTLVLFVLMMMFALLAAYFYKQLSDLKKDPRAVAEKEVTQLVEKVGRLIVLPTGEMPTVATVKNPENLKKQSFFVNAKEGDRVLIYTVAKKAILYDPIADKIVEVAPLTIGLPTPETVNSALPEVQPETVTE